MFLRGFHYRANDSAPDAWKKKFLKIRNSRKSRLVFFGTNFIVFGYGY
jgi:hypothetical protein